MKGVNVIEPRDLTDESFLRHFVIEAFTGCPIQAVPIWIVLDLHLGSYHTAGPLSIVQRALIRIYRCVKPASGLYSPALVQKGFLPFTCHSSKLRTNACKFSSLPYGHMSSRFFTLELHISTNRYARNAQGANFVVLWDCKIHTVLEAQETR